jgi:flagellar biosynthesis/type III secretory pathway protein FliH
MFVKISDIMELLDKGWVTDAESVVDAASLAEEVLRLTDVAFNSGFEAGMADGKKKGREEGYHSGYESGFEAGYADGHYHGYEEGYTNGRASAMSIDRSGDGGACGWRWRW